MACKIKRERLKVAVAELAVHSRLQWLGAVVGDTIVGYLW